METEKAHKRSTSVLPYVEVKVDLEKGCASSRGRQRGCNSREDSLERGLKRRRKLLFRFLRAVFQAEGPAWERREGKV